MKCLSYDEDDPEDLAKGSRTALCLSSGTGRSRNSSVHEVPTRRNPFDSSQEPKRFSGETWQRYWRDVILIFWR